MSPEEIQEIRERFGLSRGELGELIGLNAEAIRRYETGLRSPSEPCKVLLELMDYRPQIIPWLKVLWEVR